MIRRLDPNDAEVLKELRLAALADAPTAYAATLERAVAYSDADWRALLSGDHNPTFVWEDERGTHGMVVAVHDRDDPDLVHLYAMWVRTSGRSTGVADALVARVLDWARERSAKVVRLHVTEGNERAARLYARHGFVETGHRRVRERDGLGEFEMAVSL